MKIKFEKVFFTILVVGLIALFLISYLEHTKVTKEGIITSGEIISMQTTAGGNQVFYIVIFWHLEETYEIKGSFYTNNKALLKCAKNQDYFNNNCKGAKVRVKYLFDDPRVNEVVEFIWQ